MRFVALLPLLLVATVAEAKKPKPPESVAMQFGWKAGWEAEVHTEKVKTEENTGQPTREERLDARYDLRVEVDGDGLALRQVQGSLVQETRIGGVPKPRDPGGEAFVKHLSSVPVIVHIGATGAFGGLADEAATRVAVEAAMGAAMDEIRPLVPPERVEAFEARRKVLNADAILAPMITQLQSDWIWEVGFWGGRTFEVGVDYGYELDRPGVGDGPRVIWATLPRVEGHEPCHDGPGAPVCVKLTAVHRADAASIKAAAEQGMAAAIAAAASQGQVIAVGSMSKEERWTGLVEPSTLRPWRWQREVTSTGTVLVDGKDEVNRQTETEVTTWTWR